MCRRIVEHWAPCHHQRLMHIVPCDTARGTPGLSYEDCPEGGNAYIEDPSNTPCPICQRNASFRDRVANSEISVEVVAEALQRPNAPTPPTPLQRSRSSTPTSFYTATTIACKPGEHDLRDVDNGEFSCIRCGAIRGWTSQTYNAPRSPEAVSPLVSFADDEDHEDVSTPHGPTRGDVFNPNSERSPSEYTALANDTLSEQLREALEGSSTPEDAPTPLTMTSNGRAEASWKMYQDQVGRRLPDY